MDAVELVPGLYFLRFPVGHVYLWRDPDGLTLVDTGLPGSAGAIAEAVRGLGCRPEDVRRVVLTHFHEDHVGSAAAVAGWGGAEVCAHRADAPYIRGEAAGPPPVLEADWERELHRRVTAGLPAEPPAPVRVDRELADGDVLEFGGGARVVAVPGHTPGSLALHLPGPGVLFTGDTVARAPDGRVMRGVFNADPAGTEASFRRLAELAPEVVCFGHGEPLVSGSPGGPATAPGWVPPDAG
ncbi:MBL fold metallo-hydrolase [Peterkaempfera griseoplana]|uniref:MBL fold metallo-hydrolase n=1 Tax=Peterkaempfera griseoplana TaxID=66896 RepID=UPI0006E15BD2|nr:MBL fold metallo-hydrolase [Peterkaempfera griseoplana]